MTNQPEKRLLDRPPLERPVKTEEAWVFYLPKFITDDENANWLDAIASMEPCTVTIVEGGEFV